MTGSDDNNENNKDGFLNRWSQRKVKARQPAAPTGAALSNSAAVDSDAASSQPLPSFDPASLPAIESLTAASDFTPFLAAGVPENLKLQALRQLWRVEPSVLNYQPLVEYNWDFNAPGYGQLLASDDVKKLVSQVLSGVNSVAQQAAPMPETSAPKAPLPITTAKEADLIAKPISKKSVSDEVTPKEPIEEKIMAENAPANKPRRHGGALPR